MQNGRRGGRPARRSVPDLGSGRPKGFALWLLAILWLAILFEPQWILVAFGTTAGLKLPVVLYVMLAATLAIGLFNVKAWRSRWTWFAPYLSLVAVAAVTVPLAPNPGLANDGVTYYTLMWLLIVGTVTLVDSARRIELLLTVFALQFLFWGLWAPKGFVPWHTGLSNYDGFGSFMVIGGGLCSFMLLASDNKWFRRAMGVAVALCAVGVVASFARGAFLGALVVGLVVWARSPRKGLTMAGGLACLVLVLTASSLLHGGAYWEEISTIAQGTGEATGEDRWEIWKAATLVFLEHPILGVGARNWGVFASEFFRPGDLGGDYTLNPGMLYNKELHSSYFQILAEHGLLGVAAFLWILADFWKRNLQLRTKAAQNRWQRLGGRLRLRHLALSLEIAFIGWLCAAALYSMAGLHWFYTLLALNLTLHQVVERGASKPAGAVPREKARAAARPRRPVAAR